MLCVPLSRPAPSSLGTSEGVGRERGTHHPPSFVRIRLSQVYSLQRWNQRVFRMNRNGRAAKGVTKKSPVGSTLKRFNDFFGTPFAPAITESPLPLTLF